jgi:hypothetical protein
VNTLLVVAAAWRPLVDLWRRLGRMRALGVVEGEAAGEAAIAGHRVAQVGRRASDDADRKAILFHDRSAESVVHGGSLRLDGDAAIEVAAAPPERAEVWVTRAAQERAARCASLEAFDEAYGWAKKARGFEREVWCSVASGAHLWIVGRRAAGRIEAPEGAPLLLATFDPRRWCRARAALLVAFMLAMPAAAALITYLALYPPLFGSVSIVGCALGLAFFLLVQPAGTALRDAVLVPSCVPLRGSWLRPGSQGRAASEPLYAE